MSARVVKVLTVGSPTPFGLVYGREVCDAIVSSFRAMVSSVSGKLVLGMSSWGRAPSHAAKACWTDGDDLMILMVPLLSEEGAAASEALGDERACMVPVGRGRFVNGTTQVDPDTYEFVRFDIRSLEPDESKRR